MTNDDLLGKLYDSSLTPEEERELHTRMEHSPDFAAEVQEFLSVVHLLKKEKEEEEHNPILLSSTRDKVLALIAAAGTAGVGGSLLQSSTGGKIAGTMMQWVIGIVGIVGVSSIILWNTMFHKQTSQTPHQTPSGTIAQTPKKQEPVADNISRQPVAPSAATSGRPAATPEATTKLPVKRGTDIPQKQQDQNASQKENSSSPEEKKLATASTPPSNDNDRSMQLVYMKKRLEQEKIKKSISGQANALETIVLIEEANGQLEDALLDAQQHLSTVKKLNDEHGWIRSYISIGRLQRKLKKFDEAEQSLTRALEVSRSEETLELRATVLGEIGLLYEEKGDLQLSIQKLNACVRLLQENGSPDARQWEVQLQRVQARH